MKLHEIIKVNEEYGRNISIAAISPYKRSLLTYYRNQFSSEPILMVTTVFNAAQYGKIVPADNFGEIVREYVEDEVEPLTKKEIEDEIELISFQSIPLNKL